MENTDIGAPTLSTRASLVAQRLVKVSAWNAGDPGSIPGWGTSPGEGNGNPLQYSCLANPMDRDAWNMALLCTRPLRNK